MRLSQSEYQARVNDIHQVTVPQIIRERYGIKSKDEIILEFKGKIEQTRMEPKEIKKQEM